MSLEQVLSKEDVHLVNAYFTAGQSQIESELNAGLRKRFPSLNRYLKHPEKMDVIKIYKQIALTKASLEKMLSKFDSLSPMLDEAQAMLAEVNEYERTGSLDQEGKQLKFATKLLISVLQFGVNVEALYDCINTIYEETNKYYVALPDAIRSVAQQCGQNNEKRRKTLPFNRKNGRRSAPRNNTIHSKVRI